MTRKLSKENEILEKLTQIDFKFKKRIKQLRNEELFTPGELRYLDPLGDILLSRWRMLNKIYEVDLKFVTVNKHNFHYDRVLTVLEIIHEIMFPWVHNEAQQKGMIIVQELYELAHESYKVRF